MECESGSCDYINPCLPIIYGATDVQMATPAIPHPCVSTTPPYLTCIYYKNNTSLVK